MNRSELQIFLCQAISGSAEGSAWNVLTAEDWSRLVHLAEIEGVAPLLNRWVKSSSGLPDLPDKARSRLEQAGYASAAHNAVLFQALDELQPALAEQGIDTVPLKGAWLARNIYPEMGLRRMSDLDLLVKPESLQAALRVLEGLGYRLQKITYHAVLLGGPAGDLAVELHWTLPGGQALPDWLWRELSHEGPRLGGENPMLAHLLYLCAHLAITHPDQPRLLWLYDLRLLLAAATVLTWEDISAKARTQGWESAVQSSLALAAQHLGAQLPDGFPMSAAPALEKAVQPPYQAPWVRRAWSAFSLAERLRLMMGLLFPAAEYMRWKYHPRPAWLWPLWYPKRWASMARENWSVGGVNILRKRNFWFWISGLMLIILAAASVVYPKWLTNRAMLEVTRSPACDPDWFVCHSLPNQYPPIQFDGSSARLEKARSWLETSLKFHPASDMIRLHLAEILFAQGERNAAAHLVSDISESDRFHSPLLKSDRYEERLIQAYHAMEQKDWDEAIYNFRLGLAWGDERTLPADQRDYVYALAEQQKTYISNNPADANAAYLAGRYLAEAGDLDQAEHYLRRIVSSPELTSRQRAWAQVTLGRINEHDGDQEAALDAYRSAWDTDSTLRQAGVSYLGLLREKGFTETASQVEMELKTMGPGTWLGAVGDGFQELQPAQLPSGWRLVGYDIDEELLQQVKGLELLLWWQRDGEIPAVGDWTRVGDYRILRQQVTNLFPNAGFEWGVDERGLPLGYHREIYDAPRGSVLVEEGARSEQSSHLMVTNNSPAIQQVGLATRLIAVDPVGEYLMSAWIRDEGGFAVPGRSCQGPQFTGLSPYFITSYQPDRPLGNWIQHAELAKAHPGTNPALCENLLLNNSHSIKPAWWDHALMVRIQTP